ncbi:hypothetical protein BTUL_0028g00140 [Botrytis tulipae]|uniref:NAD(P)-binding domain-containing protein n=1 Tax=Botrytis tulipae TaxID=87230 RepID=A0A4Z1EVE0_9HELO|nr:hypothetical protein BTUL_0028g00140 [Botrytis tulipae]
MTQLTWLITGCSSGFGEELILSVLARGDRAIATTRGSTDRIQHLKDAGAATMSLDVTDSQAKLDAKVQEALKIYDGIDVLINNAGKVRLAQAHIVWENLEWKCLQKETSQFGIRTVIIEPGYYSYRTKVYSEANVKWEPLSIPEYEPTQTALKGMVKAVDGNQPGDPKKAAERIIDIVRREGLAAGKETPLRLSLGPDCLQQIKDKCLSTLKILEDWEELIHSTNLDGK